MQQTEESVTFDLFTPSTEVTFTPEPNQNENSTFSVSILIRFVVGVIITLLNVAVIHCTRKWKRIKRTTRMLFLNLAASDILFAISTVLTTPLIFPQAKWMSNQICLVTYTFTAISRCACGTGIMLLAFDIFVVTIVFNTSSLPPFVFKGYFIRTVIGVSWFALMAFGVWIALEISRNDCLIRSMIDTTTSRVVVLVIVVQSFISVFFYTMTFVMAAHRIRKIKASVNPENVVQTAQYIKRLQREMKIVQITVALGLLYFMSHGPNVIALTAIGFFGVSIPLELIWFTSILLYFNAMGNCIIYWWRSMEFRTIWRQLFSTSCRLNTVSIQTDQLMNIG